MSLLNLEGGRIPLCGFRFRLGQLLGFLINAEINLELCLTTTGWMQSAGWNKNRVSTIPNRIQRTNFPTRSITLEKKNKLNTRVCNFYTCYKVVYRSQHTDYICKCPDVKHFNIRIINLKKCSIFSPVLSALVIIRPVLYL
jgi:hypothetical protein